MLSQDMFGLANSFHVREYPPQNLTPDFSCMIMPFWGVFWEGECLRLANRWGDFVWLGCKTLFYAYEENAI